VYLPTYLREAYGLEQNDAAQRMAGFVVLAVLMRPAGGWLSDRVAPLKVLAGAFAVVCVCAAVQATTPDLMPVGTIAFLTMAACLGAASGAVFAHVAQRAPQTQVGSVTGLVGAAGGLGGFVPPLVMGSVYTSTGSYAGGLLALAVVAALSAAWCLFSSRRPATTGATA
jgi:NNP family nitrate/nitrite transporter-like MFS transporter